MRLVSPPRLTLKTPPPPNSLRPAVTVSHVRPIIIIIIIIITRRHADRIAISAWHGFGAADDGGGDGDGDGNDALSLCAHCPAQHHCPKHHIWRSGCTGQAAARGKEEEGGEGMEMDAGSAGGGEDAPDCDWRLATGDDDREGEGMDGWMDGWMDGSIGRPTLERLARPLSFFFGGAESKDVMSIHLSLACLLACLLAFQDARLPP